jgi:enamine deaminase RidA (YjgF/YER057c/UK114 family)
MRETAITMALVAVISACAERPAAMTTTTINPTPWSEGILDQARVIEGGQRVLIMSGQVSVSPDPDAPLGIVAKHPNDMRAQFQEALSNVDVLLAEAGMTRDDIVHMRFNVTDMEAGLSNFDVFLEWLGESENRPPQSFIGVNALVLPELMIEIEVTAVSGGG